MPRYPPYHHHLPPHQGQRKCAQALLLLLVWIWVAMGLRYGYYGKHQLVLGPNSSRMMKTSSLFVEQVQVKDKASQGILLYGFKERPELSLETNWTVSNHLFVDSYDRQGFSMWLNKGSRIWMAWEVTHGGGSHEDMLVVLIKGEQNLKELQRYYPGSHVAAEGNREAEYTIAEDDSYYFGVVNLSPRTMVLIMKVNVTSKIYDISRASNICSTTDGLCKLELHLPSTCYYVLTTPNTDMPITVWQVELSFVARLVSYLVITGFIVVIVYMVLKYLGACDSEQTLQVQVQTEATETDPILPRKEMPCTYGTNEEEPESSSSSSSEDLYDGKICVICYDERRNCFFTPCGHSATCYTCAKRIMEDENKVCPICRRLIHKLRRLFSSRDDPQSAMAKEEENLNCEPNNILRV
ncbi:E3 ubiquitin-protein ligase APD1 [Phoenix dactylifera]|uniref:E3 ubiquitin-protein ligase APD1 n=1 Tax=Phoenix dactylifera TaxID=42345 RepID=A0A8B8J150_PHODC|nr:E3 ubiquitin-protein ligase APD1 [Phoenix dactylifera]